MDLARSYLSIERAGLATAFAQLRGFCLEIYLFVWRILRIASLDLYGIETGAGRHFRLILRLLPGKCSVLDTTFSSGLSESRWT